MANAFANDVPTKRDPKDAEGLLTDIRQEDAVRRMQVDGDLKTLVL